MERIGQFALQRIDDEKAWLERVESGERWRVPGIILEDQFQLDDGRLLVIASDNCPYEEALHLLLLMPGSDDYERVDLEMENTPGIYKPTKVTAGNSLNFRFFSEEEFQVTISEKRSRDLSRVLSHSGIRYRSPLQKKHLNVRHIKSE